MSKELEAVIKPYCLIELFGDPEFTKICNDECEIVDDKLHINEDPVDDVDLKYVTKVWHFNNKTQGFDLVWSIENGRVI